MKNYLFSLLFLLAALNIQAQDKPWVSSEENESIKELSEKVTDNGRVYFKKEARVKRDDVFGKHKKAYGLSNDDKMKLVRTETGDLGKKHYGYQQYYQGVRVEGGEQLVHVDKEGDVASTNGHLVEDLKRDIKPKVSEKEAVEEAVRYVDAKKYAWEDSTWEEQIKRDLEDRNATYFPKGEVVFARKAGKKDYAKGSYELAYKFDITTLEPFSHVAVYVSAVNGKVFKQLSLMHASKTGSGNTLYNGIRNFKVERAGLINWRLFAGFSGGVNHHTKASSTSDPGSTPWWLISEYKDGDGHYNNSSRNATSAHWGAETSLAYFLNVHGRNGMYNGYKLRMHPRAPGATAYFDRANGYDNIYLGFDLHAIDIIGHEYTHGVIRASSNLEYAGESGALNESFADIFGVAIQRFVPGAGGGLNWTQGEQWFAVRNLQNPNASLDVPQPDTFGEPGFWANPTCGVPTNANDWCGVHTNSGVQNRWFFLLSQGGTQNGVNVAGIGFDNAIRVAFRNMTVYLTSTSDHQDARDGAIDAAEDLFGACSAQVTAVTNAWAAVGVGAAAGACVVPLAVNISGSYSLNQYQTGSWTANPSGGVGGYTYRWSMRTAQTGGFVGPVSTNQTYSQLMYPSDQYIEVRVDVTSGGVQRSASRYTTCNNCGGNFTVSIYPNPAVDEINVDLEGVQTDDPEESTISLYDDVGNRFYQQKSQSLKEKIDTSSLPPGTYYIEIANKEGILRKRIRIEGK